MDYWYLSGCSGSYKVQSITPFMHASKYNNQYIIVQLKQHNQYVVVVAVSIVYSMDSAVYIFKISKCVNGLPSIFYFTSHPLLLLRFVTLFCTMVRYP